MCNLKVIPIHFLEPELLSFFSRKLLKSEPPGRRGITEGLLGRRQRRSRFDYLCRASLLVDEELAGPALDCMDDRTEGGTILRLIVSSSVSAINNTP